MLGSSGGAVIALDLLVRHPDRISGLIAHEPPVLSLLPDGPELVAYLDSLEAVGKEHGVSAAVNALLTKLLPEQGAPNFEPGFDWDEEFPTRMAGNSEFWFAHEARPGFSYSPDLTALKAVADRLVVGVGRTPLPGPRHGPA